jgi:hypothetical protein
MRESGLQGHYNPSTTHLQPGNNSTTTKTKRQSLERALSFLLSHFTFTMENKLVTKQILIDVTYANEWQYAIHHKALLLVLYAYSLVFKDPLIKTNIGLRNKKNKIEFNGDIEFETRHEEDFFTLANL